jgi:hypothetical protein
MHVVCFFFGSEVHCCATAITDGWRRSVVSILPRSRFREVRVVDRLLCADAAGRIVHQHALEEVQSVLAEHLDAIGVDHLVVLLPLPLGEAALEVWERLDTWPVSLGGSAQDAEDLEDFVDLGVTREEGLAGGHLGEDAADGPHVDTSGVLATAEKDLRCAVPQSDDFVCVGTERDTECAGQAEIRQLQVALLVDEQVLRFEVTVQDAVGVAVAGSLEELEREFLDLKSCQHLNCRDFHIGHAYHVRAQTHVSLATVHDTLRQRLAATTLAHGQCLHVLLQIQVQVLEDEVELVAVGVDDVEEADNVWVVHFLEQRNLADGGRRNALILGLETDLLQRNDALVGSAQVESLVDDTVRTCKERQS